MSQLSRYKKAIAGLIAPGVPLFAIAVSNGVVSQREWLGILAACLGGFVGVVAAPANGNPQPTGPQDPEA